MRTDFLRANRFAWTLLLAAAPLVVGAQQPTPAADAAAGAAISAGAGGVEASASAGAAAPSVLDAIPDGALPADGPILGEGIVIDGAGDPNVASELFYNYYVPPVGGGVGASMYPAPLPVPPHVGHVYYTYQPFYPHEHLYAHSRTYYRYHPGFEGYHYNGLYGRWPNYAGYGGHGYAGPDGFTPYTKTHVRWATSRWPQASGRIFGNVRNLDTTRESP